MLTKERAKELNDSMVTEDHLRIHAAELGLLGTGAGSGLRPAKYSSYQLTATESGAAKGPSRLISVISPPEAAEEADKNPASVR